MMSNASPSDQPRCCVLHRLQALNQTVRDVVASIQIYFEGANFFPSQGGGRSFGQAQGTKGRVSESGACVLGEGAASPLPTSYTEMPYNVYVTTERLKH